MIGGKLIKVCGMRNDANIEAVEALGVDLMGFIFYPKSPRYVASRPQYMPTGVDRVGVFVNESEATIVERIAEFGLDYVQLHGGESPQFCTLMREHGVKVIKAISVASRDDMQRVEEYDGVCDVLLFDTKCDGYGGSGESFDWSILADYMGATPFMLSGGIGLDNIGELVKFDHPKLMGYDLNSRFESAPAMKDISLLNRFLAEITSIDS